jgi:hypothetical protein
MRRGLLFTVATLLGVGMLSGSASALTGGADLFMFGTGPGLPDTVTLYGDVFTGVGTRVLLGGGHQDWVFDQGTLSLRLVPSPRTETFDETTCDHAVVVQQRLIVEGGTGVFEGATGGGSFTNTRRAFHLPGPEGCSHESMFQFTIIEGSITLDLPTV